jgi:DNA mismatch repair protein MSH4
MLKHFVGSVNPVFEALTGTGSSMLHNIREVGCLHPMVISD